MQVFECPKCLMPVEDDGIGSAKRCTDCHNAWPPSFVLKGSEDYERMRKLYKGKPKGWVSKMYKDNERAALLGD